MVHLFLLPIHPFVTEFPCRCSLVHCTVTHLPFTPQSAFLLIPSSSSPLLLLHHPSIHLLTYQSICPSFHPFIYPSICQSPIHQPIASIHPPTHPSPIYSLACPFLPPPIHAPADLPFTHQSALHHLFTCVLYHFPHLFTRPLPPTHPSAGLFSGPLLCCGDHRNE